MKVVLLQLLLLNASALCSQFGDPEESLLRMLLDGYYPLERPAAPGDKVTVTLRVFLVDATGMDSRNSHMTVGLWTVMNWFDRRLSWEPEHYGGLMKAYIPSDYIWTPDITLLNSVKMEAHDEVKLTVSNDGRVTYIVPVSATVTCRHAFRSNSYQCPFKFGSWVYDSFHLDLKAPRRSDVVMDTSIFEPNDHWMIVGQEGAREVKEYPCCPSDRFVTLEYEISFREKMGPSLMGRRKRSALDMIRI